MQIYLPSWWGEPRKQWAWWRTGCSWEGTNSMCDPEVEPLWKIKHFNYCTYCLIWTFNCQHTTLIFFNIELYQYGSLFRDRNLLVLVSIYISIENGSQLIKVASLSENSAPQRSFAHHQLPEMYMHQLLPQSNRMVECLHGRLKAAFTSHPESSWLKALPPVLLSIRNVYGEQLTTTSANIFYGEPLWLPGTLLASSLEPDCHEDISDLDIKWLGFNLCSEQTIPRKHPSFSRNSLPAHMSSWGLTQCDELSSLPSQVRILSFIDTISLYNQTGWPQK